MLLRILAAALAASLGLAPGAALAAPDLQLAWESETSGGKLVLAGTVTAPQPVAKDTALHLEVHRAGDAAEKLETEGAAAKKAKKLKFVVKGLGEGSYQVRVWADLDGDGACGAGDLDGWFAGKAAGKSPGKAQEAVLAQAGATPIELEKKPNRKVDFMLGTAPAAAGDAAAPAAPAPQPAAGAPPAQGAAPPAEGPGWLQHGSGPWTEGSERWIIGVTFGSAEDPAGAEAKARTALRDKNDDFGMLLANQYRASRAKDPAKPSDAEVEAVAAAWGRASGEPDAVDAWSSPTGGHHARVRTEVTRAVGRIGADTAVPEPVRKWVAANATATHDIFTQLER